MTPLKSLRSQLSIVFVCSLALLGAVGIFSMVLLNEVNRESESIRDHWLQSTRVLGDINNYTSDFRAAEASHLVAAEASPRGGSASEIAALEDSVQNAIHSFEKLQHMGFESVFFDRYKTQWMAYLTHAKAVIRLIQTSQLDEARRLFLTQSRASYAASSDTLGELTALTVAAAAAATDHAAQTYLRAKRVMLGTLALSFVAISGLLMYISRSVSRPLSDLAQRMRDLANHRTDVAIHGQHRKDEIGAMARAVVVFRRNAIELAQSQQYLTQQATMLEEKLEQEKRLTTLQRNFVSMVSHEFRTPLTIIDGHAQRLIKLKESVRAEDIEERARKMRGAVLRMTRVMESLLLSAQLFEGQPNLYVHAKAIDPAKLLHDVCHLYREIAPGAFIFESFRKLPAQITGDLHLLFQAFGNLLSNALKYSPSGSEVLVCAEKQGEMLRVSVKDKGVGIPPEDMPRLFERYYRGNNVRDITGTGIGLYLVKMVVELHHGQVSVASKLGVGSEFVILLPLDKSP
jgi:two-component system, OmpR family, sensor kinase